MKKFLFLIPFLLTGIVRAAYMDSISISNFPSSFGSTQSGAWNVTLLNSSLPVTGTFWQATQPVSGTVTANTGLTQPLTDTQLRASAVPISVATIPTHAVTQSGVWSTGRTWSLLNTTDSVNVGNFPSSFNIGNFPASQAVTGTFWQATQPVSVAALPLPTGASTETTLSSLNAKVPALGQALAASSTPVVLPAAQVTALTPPTSVGVNNFPATQPVSIASSVAVTGPLTDTQLRASAVPISGTVTANLGTIAGVATETTLTSLNSKVTAVNTGAVVVSSSVLPTSAATSALQTSGNASLTSIDSKLTSPLTVTGSVNSLTPDILAAGAITTTQSVQLILAGAEGAAVSVQGTWTGTIVFEISVDGGTTWAPADVFADAANGETVSTQITAGQVGNFTFTNLAGVYAVRARGNTVATGSATINIRGNEVAFSYPTYIADNGAGLPTYAIMIAGSDGAATRYLNTTLKGTQGAYGLATQSLHDAGRTNKKFSATFTAATTEAMVTLTPITEGTAGTTGTTFAVTAGKTFRLQSICVSTRNAGAAAQGVVINLRQTATGSAIVSSPLVATVAAGTYIGIANVSSSNCYIAPDGVEIAGTQQFGVSQVGSNTANNTVVITGFEY